MLPSDRDRSPAAILQGEVSLSLYTSARVGGPARYFAKPLDVRQVIGVLAWSKASSISVLPLGGGTNLLVSDRGYDGVVIHLGSLCGVEATGGERWTVAAGEPLAAVAQRACDQGLSGLEWACGIPGTVGGAAVMNSGCARGCMADVVTHVVCATSDRTEVVPASAMAYGYRTSALQTRSMDGLISEVELRLVRSTSQKTRAAARTQLTERERTIPRGASFGCAFRNPPAGPPAGALLDQAGCKGLREGGAVVSSQHANFILNDGSATATQILRLLEQMKARVLNRFAIELQEEVVVV